MQQPFRCSPAPHLLTLLLSALGPGCASGASERLDTTNGETTEETDSVQTQPPGDASPSVEPTPPNDSSTPSTSDPTTSPSSPPSPADEGTDTPSPSATVAPDAGPPVSKPAEPLCDEGEFYCNGACLSELGERANGCRIVYVDSDPFSAPLVQYRGGLLVSHDRGIIFLDPSTLATQPILEGFDDVSQVQISGEDIYVSGTRNGNSDIWVVFPGKIELTSIGLENIQIDWFDVYRSRIYYSVRIARSATQMRILDLETGVSTLPGIAIGTFAFSGDYAYFWSNGYLSRSQIPPSSAGAVQLIAPEQDVIRIVFATEAAVYWFTGRVIAPEPATLSLWRFDVETTEVALVTELPSRSQVQLHSSLSGNRLLVSTASDLYAVREFWALPLDGGEPFAVGELDWPMAEHTSHYVSELTPTHVYHAVEGSGMSVVIEAELPNPE